MLTAATIYAAIKFWLPLVTAFTLIVKAYRTMTTRITTWAETLLNNHLSHIQGAMESSVALLKEIRNDGRAAANTVKQVREDLQEHIRADEAVKVEIARDLAVLKDR